MTDPSSWKYELSGVGRRYLGVSGRYTFFDLFDGDHLYPQAVDGYAGSNLTLHIDVSPLGSAECYLGNFTGLSKLVVRVW